MQVTYLLMIILQLPLQKSVEHGRLTKINSRISHDRFYLATTTTNLHTTYQLLRHHRFQNPCRPEKAGVFSNISGICSLDCVVALLVVHHQFFYCPFKRKKTPNMKRWMKRVTYSFNFRSLAIPYPFCIRSIRATNPFRLCVVPLDVVHVIHLQEKERVPWNSVTRTTVEPVQRNAFAICKKMNN